MKRQRSLVIGKFLPPHRGHHYLIDYAAEESRSVDVIVCERSDDPIPGIRRVQWLAERHPDARIRMVEDRYNPDDSRVWADNTRRWLGYVPDAVFTSEDYGPPYAELLGAEHVMVDRQRNRVAVSGTAVRRDPYAHWAHIEPPVRAWYARRICVIGAESTGSTTLARALAAHYATACVPEYGRDYAWDKQAQPAGLWWSAEFRHIAREQRRQEDFAARSANRVLICDTNELATHLWHRRYLGGDDAELAGIAAQARCDLYLLTGDEIPYEHDGLREKPWERAAMHGWFVEALRAQAAPWIELRGAHEVRMQAAIAAIDALFADSAWRPSAR